MTMRPHPGEFLRPEGPTETERRFAPVLDSFLTGCDDPSSEIERLIAENPEKAFGHCLRLASIVRGDDAEAKSRVLESIAAVEAICPEPDHHARRHASAAQAWLDGDPHLALERYGAIVIDVPRDVLALAVAHALDFRLGLRRMLRDRVAQVLLDWHAGLPGYASVLAMYAFGLEEESQYRRAERMARRALELEPRHAGAVHVIAHVMEMQGRSREGLELLVATESAWKDTSFAIHLAWHRALFHLEEGDAPSALAIYDTAIASSHTTSELADASALLWRLQLGNVAIGDRWSQLAERWDDQALAEARPFYVAHAVMALASAGRTDTVQLIFGQLEARNNGRPATQLEEALVLPLCMGLSAFARGDYGACVERLARVRHLAHQCGGSLAQCDLIQLTLVEAALRANKANLARALVAERVAQKPCSRFNRLLEQRLA
jgi:tetratricopeptide (TPR) repeat protein